VLKGLGGGRKPRRTLSRLLSLLEAKLPNIKTKIILGPLAASGAVLLFDGLPQYLGYASTKETINGISRLLRRTYHPLLYASAQMTNHWRSGADPIFSGFESFEKTAGAFGGRLLTPPRFPNEMPGREELDATVGEQFMTPY